MNLILLCPPGAGKGTQALRLAEARGYVPLSTGDILREAIAEGTDVGRRAKSVMAAGELVSDEVIVELISERLDSLTPDQAFILDGVPRNIAQADVRGVNMRLDAAGGHFDVQLSGRARAERKIEGLQLPLVGQHNVQNALAAVAVAVEMGIDDATIRKALAGIKGVKRRFTKTGEGAGLTVIDDYGHHPD